MLKDSDGPTYGPPNKYDPDFNHTMGVVYSKTCFERPLKLTMKQPHGCMSTKWAPHHWGGIQCDGGITGGVPIP